MTPRTYPQAVPPINVVEMSSSQMRNMYRLTLLIRLYWLYVCRTQRKMPKTVRGSERPHTTPTATSSSSLGTSTLKLGGTKVPGAMTMGCVFGTPGAIPFHTK